MSKNTFILLAGHPFRITLSFDALVSKDTFFGRITCFQDLKVDIPCDKNHINQHRDTVLYMETYSNIEAKMGGTQMLLVSCKSRIINQHGREIDGWRQWK